MTNRTGERKAQGVVSKRLCQRPQIQEFLGGLVVRLQHFQRCDLGSAPVWELGSHIKPLHAVANKQTNRTTKTNKKSEMSKPGRRDTGECADCILSGKTVSFVFQHIELEPVRGSLISENALRATGNTGPVLGGGRGGGGQR